ncbi:hypothetical protein QUW13_05050 [Enterococcus hirae]|nr:hypothetical protein [Enterococcus hirae]
MSRIKKWLPVVSILLLSFAAAVFEDFHAHASSDQEETVKPLPVSINAQLPTATAGTIIAQNAGYVLGEMWDGPARARLVKSATEADGTDVPYSSGKITSLVPYSISKSIRGNRINALFADDVKLTFNSKTGPVKATARATAYYGNAILLGGFGIEPTDPGGVFALINEKGQLKIVATAGNAITNAAIQPLVGDDFYTGLAYLDLSQVGEKDLSKISVKDYLAATGNTRKQDFLNRWGSQRVQVAHPGDVIKAENIEEKIRYKQDSYDGDLSQLKNKKEIFFEITNSGYRLMHVNQLTPKKIEVNWKDDHVKLDRLLANTIDTGGNTGITVERFAEYPDTSKTGDTTAKVVVSEMLVTGHKAEFTYTVPVNVTETPGVIQSKDADYVLGEKWDANALARLFDHATESDGTSVPFISPKIFPLVPSSITNKIKNDRIDAKFADNVTLKFNSRTSDSQSVSKARVNYGNAIVLRGYERTVGYDAAGAFALLNERGQLKIIATSGGTNENLPIHTGFWSKYYLGLAYLDLSAAESKDLTNISVKDHQWANGDMKKQDYLDIWGKNRIQTVNSGDIIKVESVEAKIGYTTNSAYHQINELKDNLDVFFEITNAGYRLMHVNQLTPKKIEVNWKDDHAKLDSLLANTVDTGGNTGITVERFAEYPDTSKIGDTTAKVVVSETLVTGHKAEFTYTVPVTVQEGELGFVKLPASIDFGRIRLGGGDAKLFWQKDHDVVVSNERGTSDGWAVDVKLSSSKNSDFKNLIKWINPADHTQNNLETAGRIYTSSNSGQTNITESWNSQHVGIIIDYSTVKSVRNDEAALEWNLVATSKGVMP